MSSGGQTHWEAWCTRHMAREQAAVGAEGPGRPRLGEQMVLGGWDAGCPMCDGLSWTRESALSGCHTVIGEGHREVRGERTASNERDALGRVSSPSLRVLEPGLQKAPPSLHPGRGCMCGLGEPLFRPEPGVQTWLGPSSRCPPSERAGLRGRLGWVWFWLCWDLRKVVSLSGPSFLICKMG